MNKNTIPVVWLLTLCEKSPCGGIIYKTILAYDDPEKFYSAKAFEYDRGIFSEDDIITLSDKNTSRAEKICAYCASNGIDIITYYDKAYPEFLKTIDQPPAALFVKGRLPEMCHAPSVSIVGMRDCCSFSKKFAASVAYALAHSGFTVVSGMARGTDTYAHKGALLAGKPTVAVLPCGVDLVYPQQNSELYRRIIENGAVVSEYLPGTRCRPYFFRMRNRIISALTAATLVVESGSGGGSMITAIHALEQGRSVFAVPATPGGMMALGTNDLIRDGAIICSGPQDIIDDYNTTYHTDIKLTIPERHRHSGPRELFRDKRPAPAAESMKNTCDSAALQKTEPEGLSPKEKAVFDILNGQFCSTDDICQATGFSFPETVRILSSLELRGTVQALPGGFYKIK